MPKTEKTVVAFDPADTDMDVVSCYIGFRPPLKVYGRGGRKFQLKALGLAEATNLSHLLEILKVRFEIS